MAKTSKYRNKTDERQRVQQKFDREKIFITKYGKKINMYDMIQQGRQDTEIYPTLEKYGCMENAMAVMNDPKHREEVYMEFTELLNMRDLHDRQRAADNLWESLPLKIREQFNHDPLEFMQNGEAWLKKYAEELTARNTANVAASTEPKKQEVTTNEQEHK